MEALMVVMAAVAVLEDVMLETLAVIVLDVLVEVLRFVTGSKLRISTYITWSSYDSLAQWVRTYESRW